MEKKLEKAVIRFAICVSTRQTKSDASADADFFTEVSH